MKPYPPVFTLFLVVTEEIPVDPMITGDGEMPGGSWDAHWF